MTSASEQVPTAHLDVRNIGGIDAATLEFDGGVNVLTGRNATNRTSTLQAMMAALGSDRATLKADAEEGHVELTLDGQTHTRTLTRAADGVLHSGDPLLADPTLADRYAFLLEDNEARQAVARGEDLRSVIMDPVDTDEIEAEIQRLKDRRTDLEQTLEELDDLQSRLPELTREEQQLEADLEATRADLQALEAEIESTNADLEQTREEKAELDDRLDDLRSVRSSLEDVRYDIETQRESIAELEAERDRYREERADLPEAPGDRIDALESEIERLRGRKQSLDSDVTDLQRIITFNEDMLDQETALSTDTGGDVTDALLGESGPVDCWTCGTTVEREQIEATTDRIRDLWERKRAERADLDAEIDERTAELETLTERQRRRGELDEKIERTNEEITQREQRIEDLRERRSTLESELESLTETVETLQETEYEEILDLHREANELEFECERLAEDLESVRAKRADIEDRLDEREAIESERETVRERIADLRTKVDRIEREAVESFNDHMDELLSVLEYTNVERIWLERTETEAREGRRTVTRSAFDLHVVRATESGQAYEDTVDHLSESEREVTGLVFALAGYLVHDVHETVPFMLLDSLEAIDAERIAALVEYFRAYADFLVVALLPEDAQALEEGYRRITDI